MMNDELNVGVDFYGRPTEALWFHLARADRQLVTVLLNVAWVTHFASQAGHIVFWVCTRATTDTRSFAHVSRPAARAGCCLQT
jgi:hypothetical protein